MDSGAGASAVGPYALYNHADALISAQRYDEALELLSAQQPEDEEIAAHLRTLEVVVHTRRDDPDAALAVLERGSVGAYARFNLGIAMANAEHLDRAVELVGGACEELETKEDRSSCLEMLEGMKAVEGE